MFLYLLATTAVLAVLFPPLAIPTAALTLYLYPLPSLGVLAVLAAWKWHGSEISQRITHYIDQWRNRK